MALVLVACCVQLSGAAALTPNPFTETAGVDPALQYPMTMPVDGRVESLIGGGCPSARVHAGIDISSPSGEPTAVHAVAAGFARAVDTGNGYGLTVEIVHFGDGARYLSRYAHLSAAFVSDEGQWVAQGEVVGTTGATGNAEVVHLHFEVRDADDAVVDLNPAFRSCRRDVAAGAPVTVELPGLVPATAVAAEALVPNVWAATGVGPGVTAAAPPECRYWDRATETGDDRCEPGRGDGHRSADRGPSVRAGG